jgi:F-type H+-transporting ATPase subunit gamma
VSDTAASLRHKIASAGELESVVRTMKAIAASSIGQYENAVRSLDDYYRTVQLGLAAGLRAGGPLKEAAPGPGTGAIGAVVFGSDQGLVGQFNEVLLEFVVTSLEKLPGSKRVWAVGERIQARLAETGLPAGKVFALPNSIGPITPLIGAILVEIEARRATGEIAAVYLFHHRPQASALYKPASQRLLPLDAAWRADLTGTPWPTRNPPELMNGVAQTLQAFLREFLFVSLFRACAESLASENASRLAAMQRAEKNIAELLETLNRTFHRLRQSSIDEELFDVVAGFEALSGAHAPRAPKP